MKRAAGRENEGRRSRVSGCSDWDCAQRAERAGRTSAEARGAGVEARLGRRLTRAAHLAREAAVAGTARRERLVSWARPPILVVVVVAREGELRDAPAARERRTRALFRRALDRHELGRGRAGEVRRGAGVEGGGVVRAEHWRRATQAEAAGERERGARVCSSFSRLDAAVDLASWTGCRSHSPTNHTSRACL